MHRLKRFPSKDTNFHRGCFISSQVLFENSRARCCVLWFNIIILNGLLCVSMQIWIIFYSIFCFGVGGGGGRRMSKNFNQIVQLTKMAKKEAKTQSEFFLTKFYYFSWPESPGRIFFFFSCSSCEFNSFT